MKKNALILNESDKTTMYLVGCDEGDVTNYANMMGAKPGSLYLDKLNKSFSHKVANEGKASDWVRLIGSAPTMPAVFAMTGNTMYLGKQAADLQSHIKIGTDNKVTGNLKFVRKFVEVNTAVKEEQSGHYLFLYLPLARDFEVLKTQTVEVQVDSKTAKTFPPEGYGLPLIVRITENTQSIKLTVKTGSATTTRTLDVSGLKLQKTL